MSKNESNKIHWENIFQNKDTSKVSWFQEKPERSLSLIEKYALSNAQSIIDIGGGDSRLPDNLIAKGYTDLTVLDISSIALEESKRRLNDKANSVQWVVSDVLEYDSTKHFDLWHDRAVFHFIKDKEDQLKYKSRMLKLLSESAIAVIGSFSKEDGPLRCSGIDIEQHNRESISNIFFPEFEIVSDFDEIHETPSGSIQNFYWVILSKSATV